VSNAKIHVQLPYSGPFSAQCTLQRLVRYSAFPPGEAIRWFTYKARMAKNFKFDYTNNLCDHKGCSCELVVTGIGDVTSGYRWVSKAKNEHDRLADIAAQINSSFEMDGDLPRARSRDTETDYFRASLLKEGSVKLIDPPFRRQFQWPESVLHPRVTPKVEHAIKKADRVFLRRFSNGVVDESWSWYMKNVWTNKPTFDVMPLRTMILRRHSIWQMAFGHTGGRPHVVAAMANMFPRKLANAVLQISRDNTVPSVAKEVTVHCAEALDRMYRAMKIPKFRTQRCKLSLNRLMDIYMGASGGLNEGPRYTVPSKVEVNVTPDGKKFETVEQDLEAILRFIRDGVEPPIYWNHQPKDENGFKVFKNLTDEEWNAWAEKLRIFVIPNSLFIRMEHLVSSVRRLLEVGWVIQIGHKNSRGGVDRLARCLGVDLLNCWEKACVGGDIEKFDQSVVEYIVNLYYSSMLIHEEKGSVDYEIKERICKLLLKNIITRVTHLFGQLWGIVTGGVPSGCLNTSHMDSWAMAFYFFIFGVYQIHNALPEHREQLERDFLEMIRIIVYGDDHVYWRGTGVTATYFDGEIFASFLWKFFKVKLRDLENGYPFVSKVCNGWLIERGITFLKHQHIINPDKSEGQATFLPFRESKEFVVRAVFGRTTKLRDEIDVLSSVIGHAYGTYASNRDAYDRLYLMYHFLLEEASLLPGEALCRVKNRLSYHDLKHIRQYGMSTDEFLEGFPSWETLVRKNIVDWAYQDITHTAVTEPDEFDVDYWDFW